jgi:HEPN domain-containing protein
MKKSQNSLYAPDWIKAARKDWRRMEIMLGVKDTEAAGYFLQQCLEKYLKAFLLEKGWKLRKIHELDALLDDAVRYKEGLDSFRDLCERVSGYYLIERYPRLVEKGLTHKDIKGDVAEARGFIEALSSKDR